jgi:uracil-DNA glycosylase
LFTTTKAKASAASSTAVQSTLNLPKAATKDELVASLAEHPGKKDLLQLELDTLGEDWLLALQEELTKPYFISVSRPADEIQTRES